MLKYHNFYDWYSLLKVIDQIAYFKTGYKDRMKSC